MKKIVSFLFAVLILFQVSQRTCMILFYQLNKEYITNNFCEKRIYQDNDCQANCYLWSWNVHLQTLESTPRAGYRRTSKMFGIS